MSRMDAFRPDDAHTQLREHARRIRNMETTQRVGSSSQSVAGVATQEGNGTLTTFVDLATPGPSVTVPVLGATGMVAVVLTARVLAGTTPCITYTSFEVRDAASNLVQAASTGQACVLQAGLSVGETTSGVFVVSGLTIDAGPYTFKMKYRNETDIGLWSQRTILVIPV